MGTRDHLGNICRVAGGGKRDRTADLLHAMQALSQLSYTPTTERRIIAAGATLVKPSRPKFVAYFSNLEARSDPCCSPGILLEPTDHALPSCERQHGGKRRRLRDAKD